MMRTATILAEHLFGAAAVAVEFTAAVLREQAEQFSRAVARIDRKV